MQTTVATIAATLITIMALAQYHYSLAEYPSVGIILANERLKENVIRQNSIVVRDSFLLSAFPYSSIDIFVQA